MKAIWISWERHRRTRELSGALGTELFEIISSLPAGAKQAALVWRTAACLARQRPDLVVVQCPSFVLGLLAGLLKYVLGYTLVADLHNEAVRPFNYSFPGYLAMLRFVQRAADLCLVSNATLKAIVEQAGGRALVLPDKLPELGDAGQLDHERPGTHVVFICTYAPDEPYREVIEAARRLGPSVTTHITGNPRDLQPSLDPPPWVHLTGYLPDEDYLRLLSDADVVIDLTAMEDCLVCGAYEAVALEKPLVTSDTVALREYFRLGTVYTRHDSVSLAGAIADALAHKARLSREMRTLKEQLARSWNHQMGTVRRAVRLEGHA